MDRALLHLLEAEVRILQDIACRNDAIAMFQEMHDEAEYTLGKRDRKLHQESCQRMIADYKANIEVLKSELESTRSEMRDYFTMLFRKGGENDG